MDNPNNQIARLIKERDESRAAGDVLARGVSQFIHKYPGLFSDAQDVELELKKLLHEYMKVEAMVDRGIYKEMADLEKAEKEKEKG